MAKTNKHKNDEKTVRCPVEDCEKEMLSRGLHLHVRRTDGDGHGPSDDVPENINLDDAEEVGTKEVEMDYPETREAEQVARLCPYCERPYRGKHGVMIHLGQTKGRKDHPEDAPERHDLDDFAVVHVDDYGNIVEVVEEGVETPAAERRQEKEVGSLENDAVREHIEELREKGLDEEADRAEKLLL